MVPVPPADPVWEAHINVAYEFEAPTKKGGTLYPRVHWMVKARRLWQDFDLGRRDDIARLIARASAYTGPGTKGYLAPEQTQLLDPDSFDLVAPDERFLLTSKTNVWSTGKTIMEVMNLARSTDIKEFRQPKYTLKDREPTFTDDALWYSKQLRRLVEACVRYEPNKRPTFEQLLQQIRHYTAYDDDKDTDEGGPNNDDSDPMDWGDSSDSEDDDDPDDLADGMRAFDPSGDTEDPHPLSHFETRLGRSFPINGTIVVGGVDLPTPGMGWQSPVSSVLSDPLSNPSPPTILPS